jgi:hypothetical protein
MMRHITLLLLLTIFSPIIYGQVNNGKIRLLVLKRNNRDSVYKFKNHKDSTDTYLHYLGVVKSIAGVEYKIMTSCWRWGINNHRASNCILVYDAQNRYLGLYAVTTTDDLPDKVSKNRLVFSNQPVSECDPQVSTALSFANGVPKKFFRKCKGDYGDVYTFTSN